MMGRQAGTDGLAYSMEVRIMARWLAILPPATDLEPFVRRGVEDSGYKLVL